MKTNNLNENDEIQIDLMKILNRLKKKLWLIILIALLAGGGAWGYSTYIIVPQYSSTAMIYVLSKDTTLTSLADLQIGSQLTKDYKIMTTSRPVLEEVVQTLNLPMTYKELRDKITIDNPKDTRILSLSVQDSDPVFAKNIVNQISLTASDYIGDIMEMIPPKIIEDGEVSLTRISPNIKKNTIMGVLSGACLVCGLIVIRVLIDNTICTEDDVEYYLDIPVLAAIPTSKSGQKREMQKQKKLEKKMKKKKADKQKKGA